MSAMSINNPTVCINRGSNDIAGEVMTFQQGEGFKEMERFFADGHSLPQTMNFAVNDSFVEVLSARGRLSIEKGIRKFENQSQTKSLMVQ